MVLNPTIQALLIVVTLSFLGNSSVKAAEDTFNFSQPQPAASSQDDRKSGAGKASAMALAQAALAQVMCLKMMADAQKEGDSEKMAMAAMMCAQAAALAANGKENDESSKKSSSPPPQMGPIPSFEKAKIETEPKPDKFPDLPESQLTKGSTIQMNQTSTPALEAEKPQSTGNVFQEDKTFQNKTSGTPIGESKDIDSSNIALRNPPASSGFGSPGTAFSGNGVGNSLSEASPFKTNSDRSRELGEENKSAAKKLGKTTTASGGEGGSGFDDLMARYMGGMSGGNSLAGGMSGGTLDLAYGLTHPGTKQRNIFEFASDQFRRASQKGNLKPNSSSPPPVILRAITSQ